MAECFDLADLREDARIDMIGRAVMRGKVVGVVVDKDPGKAERYIQKVQERFPAARVVGRGEGPIAGCHFVLFGLAGE